MALICLYSQKSIVPSIFYQSRKEHIHSQLPFLNKQSVDWCSDKNVGVPVVIHFLFKIFIHLLQFSYSFLAVLGLHCCIQAFSSHEQRLLSSYGVQASHYYGAWALGTGASIVVTYEL